MTRHLRERFLIHLHFFLLMETPIETDSSAQLPVSSQSSIPVHNPSNQLAQQSNTQPSVTKSPPHASTHSSGKPSYWTTIKSWLIECRRVLHATKKPDMDEFKTIVKVSGLGILLIGCIGFLIAMIKELLF